MDTSNSLVELIVAISIFSVFSVSLLEFYSANKVLFHTQSQKSQKESVSVVNQELIIKGFDLQNSQNTLYPLSFPIQEVYKDKIFFQPMESKKEELEGLANVEVVHKALEIKDECIIALGNKPTTRGKPIKITEIQLNPPIFQETKNEYTIDNNVKFPIENIFTLINPLGTYYTYVTNRDEELTEQSKRWKNFLYVNEVPKEIQIKAFHTDPRYIPSDEFLLTFSIPFSKIEIEYRRENGTDSKDFTLEEIKSNANRIQLSTNLFPDTNFAEIYYTLDGKEPSEDQGQLYRHPFHIPENIWKKEGVVLRAKPIIKNPYYQDLKVRESQYILMSKSVKLPKPNFLNFNDNYKYKGQVLKISRQTSIGVTQIFQNGNLMQEIQQDSEISL